MTKDIYSFIVHLYALLILQFYCAYIRYTDTNAVEELRILKFSHLPIKDDEGRSKAIFSTLTKEIYCFIVHNDIEPNS